MNIDIDDLLCEAQDYYFEEKYEEAIEILEKGKEIEKDGEIYDLLVLCYLEIKKYSKAFETTKEWRKIAKRDTFKKCILTLMRTSYLVDEKETFKRTSQEMIELDENIEETIILYYDMFPEELKWIIETIERKRRKDPQNGLLKEIERRIKKEEEYDEKERKKEIGEINYSIGLMIPLSDVIRNGNEDEKNKLIKEIEIIIEISEEKWILNSIIDLLKGNPIGSHGIHMIMRKHSHQ